MAGASLDVMLVADVIGAPDIARGPPAALTDTRKK